MPELNINIHLGNAAFADNAPGAVAKILRKLADRIEAEGAIKHSIIRDENGNTVGAVSPSMLGTLEELTR